METAIVVEGIGKQYRLGGSARYRTLREAIGRRPRRPAPSFWALRDVSFELDTGEVLGVIGRNGAGKSTLLKVLSRVTVPTTGTARIQGRLGSLLEVGTGFHPELSGRENIYLNGSILGMRRREIEARFDEIVEFAELSEFLDTPVKRYSSGMYVRLAFSVAAHLEPEILVVDEVLAVGDAEFQRRCLGRMSDVSRSGRTVMFVSHNMAAIRGLCSRAILLDRGRVIADGPVADVTAQYLRSAAATRGTTSFERPPDARAWIERVEVSDVDGHPRDTFAMDEGIRYRVRYRVEEPVAGLALSFQLRDPYDQPLVHAPIRDSDVTLPTAPGSHDVEAQWPPIGLYPDHYNMLVTLTEPQTGTAFETHHQVAAGGFTIEQSTEVAHRTLSPSAGRIHVPVQWRTWS